MSGKVYLVGAGPGDPELLTVKAVRILQSADLVLHDALVSDAVLALIPPPTEVIHIGKRAGKKLLTQDEINAVLVHYANTAKTVVRLKGGDPLIFGRAGEEMDALRAAGVEFEVVPGITASLAAAAAAGVSLTDRRLASQVMFITAHREPGKRSLEWPAIPQHTTLVVYMPGSDYGEVGESLIAAGLDADTPCVIIASASQPNQQMRWSDLRRLAHEETLRAPALMIVGRVARSAAALRDAGIWNEVERYQQRVERVF
jgi:uroporphyrin-III C-methyltransferase